jgi:ribose transport system ATP-binding protein
MMAEEIILRTEKLCKAFGPTKANIDVDFELRRGEIHGLVGENGSGKSTLLSQIAGMYKSDSGSIYLKDEAYVPQSPLDAYAHSIGIVVQELGVIAALPAGVNVFLGRTQAFTKGGIVNLNKMNAVIRELAAKWNLADIPFGRLAGSMNVESRKMIELLRALALDPDILILDEITQALSLNNRKRLYDVVRRYKEMGRSVIMISHDLDEILDIADTLTVLRDGRVVNTVKASEITGDDLKRMMVGRMTEGEYYRSDDAPSRAENTVLSVRDLKVKNDIRDINFDVYAGEIIGFCGLSDSGIHTIGKALYGLEEDATGAVTLTEKNISIDSPQIALKNRVAYVPKERDGEGLMLGTDIRSNFVLPSIEEMKGSFGYLKPSKLNAAASGSVEKFAVRCQSVFQGVSRLSGGNKQKINLGRWIAKDLDLLILDCPTRGVDVGVKAYIYQLMRELKSRGLAIVLISDELLEVLGMADRIFVVNKGAIAKEIHRGPDFSEEKIIEVMV